MVFNKDTQSQMIIVYSQGWVSDGVGGVKKEPIKEEEKQKLLGMPKEKFSRNRNLVNKVENYRKANNVEVKMVLILMTDEIRKGHSSRVRESEPDTMDSRYPVGEIINTVQ